MDGRSYMENNPSSQTASDLDSIDNRRSTRIDYVTTVLLSGKDAGGAPFREFTQTSVVNLHGCKLRTSYRITVGVLLSIECPKAGTAGKGVCVRVWDTMPGATGCEIAVQLIRPQNLWGVPNPPADWELVVKTMVQGRRTRTEPPARPVTPAAPNPPAPVVAPRPSAIPPVVAPAAPPVVPSRPAPVAGSPTDPKLADLERRATQLMEAVLDILRGQAEELTRVSLDEFRQQIEAMIQDSDARLRQGLQQTYEKSVASLISLRSDLMEQMASRGAQMVRSTEEAMRVRLRSQLATEDETPPAEPPEPVAGK